jgi:hypothetical protein
MLAICITIHQIWACHIYCILPMSHHFCRCLFVPSRIQPFSRLKKKFPLRDDSINTVASCPTPFTISITFVYTHLPIHGHTFHTKSNFCAACVAQLPVWRLWVYDSHCVHVLHYQWLFLCKKAQWQKLTQNIPVWEMYRCCSGTNSKPAWCCLQHSAAKHINLPFVHASHSI